MNNADFWASIRAIIDEGFTPKCLLKLDGYAEQFISGKLVYQRFSPQEQHGCSAGGTTNVIASLLAGAEAGSDSENQAAFGDPFTIPISLKQDLPYLALDVTNVVILKLLQSNHLLMVSL